MTKLQRVLSLISNISLGAGAAIGIYALIRTYLLYRSLPADVCPIDTNRPWMYTAIALLAVSFILSWFEPKKNKQKKGDEQ